MTPDVFKSKTKVTKQNAGKVDNKLYRNFIPLVKYMKQIKEEELVNLMSDIPQPKAKSTVDDDED